MARMRGSSRGHVLRLCTDFDKLGQLVVLGRDPTVTAINRNATPSGPITELYDRLDELHLKAGMPSMREIATRAGRGRISSSTLLPPDRPSGSLSPA